MKRIYCGDGDIQRQFKATDPLPLFRMNQLCTYMSIIRLIYLLTPSGGNGAAVKEITFYYDYYRIPPIRINHLE